MNDLNKTTQKNLDFKFFKMNVGELKTISFQTLSWEYSSNENWRCHQWSLIREILQEAHIFWDISNTKKDCT